MGTVTCTLVQGQQVLCVGIHEQACGVVSEWRVVMWTYAVLHVCVSNYTAYLELCICPLLRAAQSGQLRPTGGGYISFNLSVILLLPTNIIPVPPTQ